MQADTPYYLGGYFVDIISLMNEGSSSNASASAGSLSVERVSAIEYHRPSSSGRTAPSILTCERQDAFLVEVVAKFSSKCPLPGLAYELIGACLGAELGLPVPEPFLVEISSDWSATIANRDIREAMLGSLPVAFGSKRATEGYSVWNPGSMLSTHMLQMGASIFLFDGIIQNADRRVANPNCLVRGEELLIFDHELAFRVEGILGWKPPWVEGGLEHMKVRGNHIFWEQLRGRNIDFTTMGERWQALSDAHLQSYIDVLPPEWASAKDDVKKAIELIRNARNNIAGCLSEANRVLQ